jgi:hypothetical protein
VRDNSRKARTKLGEKGDSTGRSGRIRLNNYERALLREAGGEDGREKKERKSLSHTHILNTVMKTKKRI